MALYLKSPLHQVLRSFKLHRKPSFYIVAAVWLFGLASMFILPAPVPITEDAMARYEAKLDEAAAYSKQTVNSTQVRAQLVHMWERFW